MKLSETTFNGGETRYYRVEEVRASVERLLGVAERLEHVSDNGKCFKCELIAGLKEMAK